MPFRRSWVAIAVVAAFDAVFLFPAITTFQQAAAEWAHFDDLFDLVGAVFLSAWLLGWSLAPLALTTVLALMLLGREVIRVGPGKLEIFLGLPLIGVVAEYEVRRIRNLRLVTPPKKSGKAWRGQHAVFEYGANQVAFGSDLDEAALGRITSSIQAVSGQAVRRGLATEAELAGEWAPGPLEQLKATEAEPTLEPASEASPVKLASPSTLALILANLVPVFGTAFLGWRLSDVMVIYWAESAVIGFYNVCKMVVIGRWMALLGAPFFIGHFGGFMAVHFLFLYALFVQGPQDLSGGDLREVAKLFASLWPALAALFVSHGYSFFANFMGRSEYRGRTIKDQMAEPYSRIVFMHLVLIFGGGVTLVLGEPTPVLLVVIALKIWFDIRAHLKQRGARKQPTDA
jgi:hypothetical protein